MRWECERVRMAAGQTRLACSVVRAHVQQFAPLTFWLWVWLWLWIFSWWVPAPWMGGVSKRGNDNDAISEGTCHFVLIFFVVFLRDFHKWTRLTFLCVRGGRRFWRRFNFWIGRPWLIQPGIRLAQKRRHNTLRERERINEWKPIQERWIGI